MPLANANSLTVAVETTADNSGLTSAEQAVEKYAAKIEVARQRIHELSQAENVKASTMMSATNTLNNYYQKFDQAFQKQEQEAQSATKTASVHENLTASIVGAQAAYNVLYGALEKSVHFFGSAIESANKYQSAIVGLASTARAFGNDVDQTTSAAQQLASDGLMNITDAANGLKNLLSTGFSLPEAIRLMNAFKDSAAFGRRGTLDFSTAVIDLTQGVKNGNSRMLDSGGIIKNLSVILRENGKSAQDVMNITTDSSVRQALYNGLLRETAAQAGNAAKLADTFGGSQAAAGQQVEKLKQSLGGIEQLIGGPLLQAFTKFLSGNQRAIIDFGTAAVVATGLGVALFGVVKAIQAFSLESLIAAASNPLILALTVLSVLAGVVVYNAVDKLQSKVKEMNKGLTEGAANMNGLTDNTGKLTKAQQGLADKLQQIDEQLAKSNRDYQENLAKAIQGIQDKVASLNEQLAQENESFAQSQEKKLDQFQKTEQSMTDAHGKRVATLQKHIDQERALGKWADQQKLNDLEQQLADENDQYNQQTADKQATYNQDVADAKKSHDEKVTDLQKQLDTENSLLKKHAADVAAVRNVTMLDEIDKIKQAHDDQLRSLEDQKQKAVQSAQQTVAGINSAYSTGLSGAQGGLATIGTTLGSSMGTALKSALESSLKDTGKSIVNYLGAFVSLIPKLFDQKNVKNGNPLPLSQLWDQAMKNPAFHLATGGPAMAGQPYLVGDNPDGSINSTTELFMPEQSGTIIPASQTRSLLSGNAGGRGGVTINQTNHIYNQVDVDAANTELGWKLVNA